MACHPAIPQSGNLKIIPVSSLFSTTFLQASKQSANPVNTSSVIFPDLIYAISQTMPYKSRLCDFVHIVTKLVFWVITLLF